MQKQATFSADEFFVTLMDQVASVRRADHART
jgi:hypothetical protein